MASLLSLLFCTVLASSLFLSTEQLPLGRISVSSSTKNGLPINRAVLNSSTSTKSGTSDDKKGQLWCYTTIERFLKEVCLGTVCKDVWFTREKQECISITYQNGKKVLTKNGQVVVLPKKIPSQALGKYPWILAKQEYRDEPLVGVSFSSSQAPDVKNTLIERSVPLKEGAFSLTKEFQTYQKLFKILRVYFFAI